MKMKAPRGTVDILPPDIHKWQHVEKVIKNICSRFNFEEVRTPVFEHTEVFQRGVGDSTDIVQKEMYTFTDRGGRSITLRPEGTAAVVRAFVENKLYGSVNQPVKLYYFAQMFRYERPQQGRMRQLNQFGVEVLGSAHPATDAEAIALAMTCYKELGLRSLKLVINSLGDKACRENHRNALIEHFNPHIDTFCSDCQSRLNHNPLRILDCKKDMEHPAMQTAPSILDYLNEASAQYFEQVKRYLDAMNISYTVDENLVRGLDYYNHTAFEIMSEAEGFGAITTLMGGGRYNELAAELGGPDTPGVGFAMGLERLMMALEAENIEFPKDDQLDCYLVAIGENTDRKAVQLLHTLRENGIQADKDYQGKKMKAQFKHADRLKAKFVLLFGEEEISKDTVIVRTMATGEQVEIPQKMLIEKLTEALLGGKDIE